MKSHELTPECVPFLILGSVHDKKKEPIKRLAPERTEKAKKNSAPGDDSSSRGAPVVLRHLAPQGVVHISWCELVQG
jgi:hypothetical protein